MRVLPIKNIAVNSIKQCNVKNIKQKFPRKVTIDNLPVVAGAVGLVTPIPFAGIALYGLGKAVQIVAKKFLHKP